MNSISKEECGQQVSQFKGFTERINGVSPN